jgi:hypothetical protein
VQQLPVVERQLAPDMAPDFFLNSNFYLNRASGAASQQGVAAPDGTPEFFSFLF